MSPTLSTSVSPCTPPSFGQSSLNACHGSTLSRFDGSEHQVSKPSDESVGPNSMPTLQSVSTAPWGHVVDRPRLQHELRRGSSESLIACNCLLLARRGGNACAVATNLCSTRASLNCKRSPWFQWPPLKSGLSRAENPKVASSAPHPRYTDALRAVLECALLLVSATRGNRGFSTSRRVAGPTRYRVRGVRNSSRV